MGENMDVDTNTCSPAIRYLPLSCRSTASLACIDSNGPFQLEMDKQGLLHNTVINRIGGKAFTAPVHFWKKTDPPGESTNGSQPRAGRQVLDLGTGTGLWATTMAE